jgi:hypothetical protein
VRPVPLLGAGFLGFVFEAGGVGAAGSNHLAGFRAVCELDFPYVQLRQPDDGARPMVVETTILRAAAKLCRPI